MEDVCPPTPTHTLLFNQSTGCKHHFKGCNYGRKMSLAILQFHASVLRTCLCKTAGRGRKARTLNPECKPMTEMEEGEFSAAGLTYITTVHCWWCIKGPKSLAGIVSFLTHSVKRCHFNFKQLDLSHSMCFGLSMFMWQDCITARVVFRIWVTSIPQHLQNVLERVE